MDNELERLGEEEISADHVFDGRILHVVNYNVELPNGHTSTREVIRHVGAVCIVAVTDDGRIVMERQFRFPLGQVITEIPAGKMDDEGEGWLNAAKREFLEETGYTAAEWTDMGVYYPAAAYCDEKITMFLARGLSGGQRKLDEDEFLDVFLMPFEEAVEKIMSGEITDGKTQAAILKAARILEQ